MTSETKALHGGTKLKVLVIGASGQIGAGTVKDLVDHYDAEVIAADLSFERVKKLAERVGKDNVTPIKLDATDSCALRAAGKGVDVILNSAWYELNIKIMPVAIDLRVHYSDLGGFYDHTLEELKYDKRAKDAGMTNSRVYRFFEYLFKTSIAKPVIHWSFCM
jgi:saccharopine dehydrogenase-like NADP-dependent oxidoreductase